MVSLWVAVFAGMGLGILVLPARAADVPLSGAIPSTVYEIELTYIGERTDPTVAFSGPPPTAAPLPYRPFLPILELHTSLGAVRPFGPCRAQTTKSDIGIEFQWSAGGAGRRAGGGPAGGALRQGPVAVAAPILATTIRELAGRSA